MTRAADYPTFEQWSGRLLGLAVLLLLSGCNASPPAMDPTSSPGDPVAQVADPASTYASRTFAVPFDITPSDWLPTEPSVDQPTFVTWETSDASRAVRVLAPVSLYAPESTAETQLPADYLAYLLSQADEGAALTDMTETTVGGRPATIVTVTADTALDGSLGCPRLGMTAQDCYGIQPDFILRIAVVEAGGGPLLIWLRSSRDAAADDLAADTRSFEEMLASLTFSDRRPQPAATPTAEATPIDGVWTASWTYDELASGPLLDRGELNDENWGEFTISFDHGQLEQTQANDNLTGAGSGTYEVDGDVLVIIQDNGERFGMRWHLDRDQLTFARDDALGVCPTPFVIKPWTRQS